MVINFNLEIEARMHEAYKTMIDTPQKEQDLTNLSPDDFWNTMQVVSLNKLAQINLQKVKLQ